MTQRLLLVEDELGRMKKTISLQTMSADRERYAIDANVAFISAVARGPIRKSPCSMRFIA